MTKTTIAFSYIVEDDGVKTKVTLSQTTKDN